MKEMFLSKLLTRLTKERFFTTYLHPIVAYACETSASTKCNEVKLAIFERKIPGIYEPMYKMDLEIFKRRVNEELQSPYN